MGSWRMPGQREGAGELYGRLSVELQQSVYLGVGGVLNYQVSGGIVLGKVPTTLLHITPSNYGFVFTGSRMTLLGSYPFYASRYMMLQTQWNGGGILFNRIPGIRYLHLRELLEAKLAWTGLDENKAVCLGGNEKLKTLNVPYLELGIGIGNILHVGELYFVGRVINPAGYYDSAWWAFRFRLKIGS